MPGFGQIRSFSREQRGVAWRVWLASLLIMGVVGETVPGASAGRVVPVAWWDYLTLALAPPLIGLIAATFRGSRLADSGAGSKAAAGTGGLLGTAAIACPACSPLAIPLFGAGGLLAFLAPERWLVALLSIALLAVTLGLRLRATRSCGTAGATTGAPGPAARA